MGQDPGSNSQEAFVLGLRAELDAFREFHQLLQTEQSVLAAGDVDALVGLAQRKSEQVTRLAQLAESRNRYLKAATGMTDQLGIDAWHAKFDPQGRVGADRAWQGLLDLARSAKQLNEQNGLLININLQHNQKALAVLRGAAVQTTQLYGPDGQSYSAAPGRPLGKA
jgi:flagella synthesis protein FlgN